MKVKMFRHMGESGKDYERKIDVARKCKEGIKHVCEGTDKRNVCMVFKNSYDVILFIYFVLFVCFAQKYCSYLFLDALWCLYYILFRI